MENRKMFRNTKKVLYWFILFISFGMLPSLSWAQEDGIISDQHGDRQGRIDKDGKVYDQRGGYVGRADVNHPISALLLLKKSQKE